jgi:2-dehydropantoate 2-reductase
VVTDDNRRRRVAVIGGGAVGGFLAARASAAGSDVTLCLRTPIDRLVVEFDGTEYEPEVALTTEPERQRPVDWVLLTTKAQDTAGAAPWLRSLAGPGTVVVICQNGVDHLDRVAPLGLAAELVPAVVYVSAERTAPGRVVHHVGGRVIVPSGARAGELAALLGPAVDVSAEDDFTTTAWRKLLSNIAANPITALTLRRTDVFADPDIRALARALLDEAVAVGRAEGAALDDADVTRTLDLYAQFGAAARGGGSSMLYDRLAGRPTEHEQITGAVVRAGRRHGIAVPMNEAVLALLRNLA